MNLSSRRGFLKMGALLPFAAAFGAQVLGLMQKAYAEGLKLVDMTKTKRKDPENDAAVAVLLGMGYVEDGTKGKRTDKPHPGGGVMKAANQFCTNCILNEDAYLDKGAEAKCKVVATALVNSKGYCNTYNVNPKAKKA